MGTCYSVSESSAVIIEKCGAFDRVAQPGFHCLICCVDNPVRVVSLRMQVASVRVETKTHDNVFVALHVAIRYHVDKDKVYESFYNMQDPMAQISAYVQNVVRSTVPSMSLDEVFVNKDKIAVSVRTELERELKETGYVVDQTLVSDIDPDANVKRAMNEINTQERLRVAAVSKAEANKYSTVKQAEAEADSKYLSGVGLARQRKAIIDGLGSSIMEFSHTVQGIDPDSIMQLVMMNQYFDTLKEVSQTARGNAVFVGSSGSSDDTASKMRMAIMEAAPASASLSRPPQAQPKPKNQ